MLSPARVFGILHYLEDNFFSVREGKDKASSQSSATKEAEHRMGKVDIGGCRIEVDDIRQVTIYNDLLQYRYSHFYFAVSLCGHLYPVFTTLTV